MFIPKIRTIIGGKIAGKLLDPATKRVHNGKFVRDFKGNFYKGETITRSSEPLLFVPDTFQEEKITGLKHIYITPTESDYKNGFVARYFIKDAPTGRVFEVKKETYLQERKDKNVHRKTLKIKWVTKGPAEDTVMDGYLYPGAASKNADTTKQAERVLTGISEQILKDPGQFVK